MEVVRGMIHDQNLPMHLWDKASRTVVYVHNIISHSSIGNKTPLEMFTGQNTKVIHLKILCCPMYLHVRKEKRSELDSLGKKAIFVGYSEQLKAYRIYILGFYLIKINRDSIFDEDKTFTKSRKIYADEDHKEEVEAPRTIESTKPPVRDIEEDIIPGYHDL